MDFRDSINAIGKIRCIMITPLFLCLKYYRVNLFIICVGDFPAIRIMPGHILNKKATYKPKPYEQMTYPGERIQVDVKVVPRKCKIGRAHV